MIGPTKILEVICMHCQQLCKLGHMFDDRMCELNRKTPGSWYSLYCNCQYYNSWTGDAKPIAAFTCEVIEHKLVSYHIQFVELEQGISSHNMGNPQTHFCNKVGISTIQKWGIYVDITKLSREQAIEKFKMMATFA